MALVGYARVSSTDQSLEIQIKALQDAGCTRIFSEKLSGTKSDNRPELQSCLRYVREGDVLMVTRLDRMARSMADFFRILADLDDRDIRLKCLMQPEMDTTTTNGRLITGVLAVIAQFETEVRRERQAEGIARAKEKGVYTKQATQNAKMSQASAMLAAGGKFYTVAKKLGLSESTLRRHFPQYRTNPREGSPGYVSPPDRYRPPPKTEDIPTSPSAAEAVEAHPTPEPSPAKTGLLGKFLGR